MFFVKKMFLIVLQIISVKYIFYIIIKLLKKTQNLKLFQINISTLKMDGVWFNSQNKKYVKNRLKF